MGLSSYSTNQHQLLSNYICDRLSLIKLILVFGFALSIGQVKSQEACPVRTALEPVETVRQKSANSYDQVVQTNNVLWDSITDIVSSNDQYASVELDRFKRSATILATNLNLNIPPGAEITGVELIIEGRSQGEGKIRDIQIVLTDAEGNPSPQNKAETGGSKSWLNGEADHIWSYGGEFDNWGLELTSDLINSANFGFQIKVRNSMTAEMEAYIDHAYLKVYYTPLYSICDHTCVTFYVDSLENEAVTYNWLIPQGFELLSYSEQSAIINVGVFDAVFGTYEICVETLVDDVVTGTCCRNFNFIDCNNSSIGDQVWNDLNRNGIFDSGDQPLEGVTVELYTANGNLLATVLTDEFGNYLFENIITGDYYIKVDPPQLLRPIFPNIGSEDVDSDITNANGQFTTDLITVDGPDPILDIDIGLSEFFFVGDLAWIDSNGDGLLQDGETGLSEVQVSITSTLGPQLATVTDGDGNYRLGPLPLGTYEVNFEVTAGLTPTLRDAGDEDIDSDIDENGSTGNVIFDVPGLVDNIDAGYFEQAVIGDFVWMDTNSNGQQDDGEPGIANISLNLLQDGTNVETVVTDDAGAYSFTVAPGTYTIILGNLGQLLPTSANVGDDTIDSDLIEVGGIFTTEDITVLSGEVDTTVDFGFVELPSNIIGLAWLDANSDGQYDIDEQALSDIAVQLYDDDNTLLEETTTDTDGVYLFEQVVSGGYYIVFGVTDDRLFTVANVGDDDTDSDVTSSISSGSTDIFTLFAGIDEETIFAGYVEKADIGDKVFLDENRNGLQDEGEEGVNEVIVALVSEVGDTLATIVTSNLMGSDGMYLFENIEPGNYAIVFAAGDTFDSFTLANVGTDEDVDSDVVGTLPVGDQIFGTTEIFSVSANEVNLTIDAGLLLPLGGVSGQVFFDENINGIDDDNSYVADITVNLFNDLGTLESSTVTTGNGSYEFLEIPAGDYYITVEKESEFDFTTADVGDDADDSDITQSIVANSTDLFAIADGMQLTDVDAGLVDAPGSVSGFVWFDADANGQLDNDETGIADVEVQLYTEGNVLVGLTTSGSDGSYQFTNFPAGNYYLVFGQSEGQIFTIANEGDDATDSDVDGGIIGGSTGIFAIEAGMETADVYAGYVNLVVIGDQVWIDTNRDGILNNGEEGINDIMVTLLDAEGNDVAIAFTETTTDGDGFYRFEDIPLGDYQLAFTTSDFYEFTQANVGDDDQDSDVVNTAINTISTIVGTTEIFTVAVNDVLLNYDAGLLLPQGSISGAVFVDFNLDGLSENEEKLADVPVRIFDESQALIASTVTDTTGLYLFTDLAAGNYYIVFEPTERYQFTTADAGDDSIDSDVTESIVTGSTDLIPVADMDVIENVDAGVVDGVSTISGLAWEDDNANGIREDDEARISDVEVSLFTTLGELLLTEVTATDGSYAFQSVMPGQYFIVFDNPNTNFINTLADQGGDDSIDDDVTGVFLPGSTTTLTAAFFTDLTNVDAGYYQTAFIGDYVWVDLNENGVYEGSEPGLDGVTVRLLDTDGIEVASTVTAAGGGLPDGYYEFRDILPGSYQIEFGIPELYEFTLAAVGDLNTDSDVVFITDNIGLTELISINSGDFRDDLDAGTLLLANASISGLVFDDGEADGISIGDVGVESFTVRLFDTDDTELAVTTTDANGNYTFEELEDGSYYISVEIPTGQVATIANVGMDDTVDSDFRNTFMETRTEAIVLTTNEMVDNIDLGLVNTLSVSGTYFEDEDVDGLFGVGENTFVGEKVLIISETGEYRDSTLTDELGQYAFNNIPSAFYKLQFVRILGTTFTAMDAGDDTVDSDVDPSGCTELFDFTAGGMIENVNAGAFRNAFISGQVWIDVNANGIRTVNEPTFDSIGVSLFTNTDDFVASTMTSTISGISGFYIFEDLFPGSYYVVFDVPEDYLKSAPNIGSDLTDSDLTDAIVLNSTDLIDVMPSQGVENIDAGIYLPAKIGDRVFADADMDGIQDPEEVGVEGIEVILYLSSGIAVDTTVSDADGFYEFDSLQQGLFFLEFSIPEDFMVSPRDVGNDEALDSDIDDTGATPLISLALGADLKDVDAGIFMSTLTALRSVAWDDANTDGIRQPTESRIKDIKVELMDVDGNLLDTTLTNSLGLYAFEGLDSGSYYIHVVQDDYVYTTPNLGDDMMDSDILLDGNSEMFMVDGSLSVPNVDIGVYTPSVIAVEVWEELTINAMYDEDEHPLKGIRAELMDAEGILYGEAMSVDTTSENVIFDKVRAGEYYVRFSSDEGHIGSSNPDMDASNPDNSDIFPDGEYFITPMVTVSTQEYISYLDAGFYLEPEEEILEGGGILKEQTSSESINLEIGPNPSLYYVEVTEMNNSNVDKEYTITLADRDGRVIEVLNVAKPDHYRVSLKGYHSGTYYMTVSDGNDTVTKKLLKI